MATEDFDELCRAIVNSIANERTYEALAIASLSLVHVDTAAYVNRAHQALRHVPPVHEVANDIEQFFLQLEGDFNDEATSDLVNWLSAHAGSCPMAILLWLDGRLLKTSGIVSLPEPFYTGVMAVQIPVELRAALGFTNNFHEVFICRRFVETTQAPIGMKHTDPETYLPNWHVIPDTPDLGQGSRKLEVSDASSGVFGASCRLLAGREDIRIYLGEYVAHPVFRSNLIDGDGKQLWHAEGLTNESAVIDETLTHLQRAYDNYVDVVVLPELMLPPTVVEAVSDWLNLNNCSDDGTFRIQWVVAGSFHHAIDGSKGSVENRATLLDRVGNNIRALAQGKLTSVDIVVDDSKMVENNEKATLPSLSKTTNAHADRAKQLCVNHVVTVVCANQAKADFGGGKMLEGKALDSFVRENSGSGSGNILVRCGYEGTTWKMLNAKVAHMVNGNRD